MSNIPASRRRPTRKAAKKSSRLDRRARAGRRRLTGLFKRELPKRVHDAAIAAGALGLGEGGAGPVFEGVVVGVEVRLDHGPAKAHTYRDGLVLVGELGPLDGRTDAFAKGHGPFHG